MNVPELVAKLRIASKEYYTTGNSPMSDDEYDAAVELLRKVAPESPYLAEIGPAPDSSSKKIYHTIPMGTLSKYHTDAEITVWLQSSNLAPFTQGVLISPKYDGFGVEIVYQDGVEVSRSIISEEVIVSPVNRVVLRGVDRSVSDSDGSGDVEFGDPVIVAPTDGPQYVPGTNLEYSEIWDFQATAYYCEPHAWNTTYTGTEARVGAIAVDPNFIPLGTRMYIVSADGKYIYGYCVAEDIGGAIKGRIVDLYFNTYQECIDFGRRDVKIYVLK